MIKKYYKKYEEIFKYIMFGVLTTIVSLTSYYICTFTFLNPDNPIELQVANIISWICAVTFAYITNKKYVFKNNNKRIITEATEFYSSRLFTLALDMLFMFVLVSILSINDEVAKLIVQVAVTVGNYLISKYVVFKK